MGSVAPLAGPRPAVKYDRMPTLVPLDAFHVWGCTAMVHYTQAEQQERGKLLAVARPLMFVGRGSNLAWRFASLESGALRCIESRDCQFDDYDFSAARRLKQELAGTELGAADRYDDPARFGNELDEFPEYAGNGELQAALDESRRLAQQSRPAVAPLEPAAELTSDSEASGPEDLFEQAEEADRNESPSSSPIKRVSFTSDEDSEDEYLPRQSRRSESTSPAYKEADTKFPTATRRSARGPKPFHRYGVLDPRDFGSAPQDFSAGAQYVEGLRELEDLLSEANFETLTTPQSNAAALKHRAPPGRLQSERERLKTLLRFNENQVVDEADLTPCNRKGERPMPSRQCCAPAASGSQCSKRTTIGAFCWIHLAKILGLRVKPSSLGADAGRGLFTTVDRDPGDEVCRYTGDLIHGRNPNFKGSVYVAQIDRNNFIDAARTDAHLGRMVNAPRSAAGRHTNLRWVIDPRRKVVRLVAKERIPAGSELFIGYGGGYWSRYRAHAKAAAAGPPPRKRLVAAAHTASVKRPATVAAADTDPRTLAEARASSDWPRWAEAIAEEEKSLKANGTFTPVDVPPGTKLLDCKWVFKRKRDQTGAVVRYKVRLVAKGFRQIQAVDYDDTFSPVMGMTSLRLLVAIAAQRGCELMLADFKTAYLNAELDKNILVRVPDGMQSYPRASALQCNRALYGLHQSGRLWYQTLVDQLVNMGYVAQSDGEQCVLVRILSSGRSIILGIYVDDILIVWDKRDEASVTTDLTQLNSRYQLTILGEAKHILGIEVIIDRSAGTIKLAQTAYLKRLCSDLGFEQCRKERTPASSGSILDRDTISAAAAAADSNSSSSQPPKPALRQPVAPETFRWVFGRPHTPPPPVGCGSPSDRSQLYSAGHCSGNQCASVRVC